MYFKCSDYTVIATCESESTTLLAASATLRIAYPGKRGFARTSEEPAPLADLGRLLTYAGAGTGG